MENRRYPPYPVVRSSGVLTILSSGQPVQEQVLEFERTNGRYQAVFRTWCEHGSQARLISDGNNVCVA